MCGIVGVLGDHEAAPALVEALKRLEYRGYDSAGIATINGDVLDRRRAPAYLARLAGAAISAFAVRDYAQMIYDLAVRRDLIQLGRDISAK
ncbi:MAG: hypothetical protein AAFR10_21175, partial [Pseudomonadota bacterium]